MVDLLTVGSILGAGLLAGGLVAVAVAVVPLMTTFERPDYLRTHRGLDSHFDPFMPLLNIATLLCATGWLALQPSGWQRIMVALGLVMALVVAGISHLRNRPINQQIAAWDPDRVDPATADAALRRWKALHYLRTAAAILGLAAYVIAGVLD